MFPYVVASAFDVEFAWDLLARVVFRLCLGTVFFTGVMSAPKYVLMSLVFSLFLLLKSCAACLMAGVVFATQRSS